MPYYKKVFENQVFTLEKNPSTWEQYHMNDIFIPSESRKLMSTFSLYERLTTTGTLSELEGVPDPRFALPSTVNWMRGLAILSQEKRIAFDTAKKFYSGVTKHNFNDHQENTIFEQLLFGLHQLSGLMALQSVPSNADVSRIGIVTWYYGIYHACSAMITAQSGTMQETHAGTAKAWDNQLSLRGLVMDPFELRVSSLVKKVFEAEIKEFKNGNDFVLTKKPNDADDAYGACCSYLSGTAKWSKWHVEQEIRGTKEFKVLDVDDFRTKEAKALRDKRLSGKTVSFLHQAYRYRGKANYREAFFLGYGATTEKLLSGYTDDLVEVLTAFLSMAGAFCSVRLGKDLWALFIKDIEEKRAFSVSANEVWSG